MVPASRFTSAFCTPATDFVTFSTRAEQAAQVIPVTLNFSFIATPPFLYIIVHIRAEINYFYRIKTIFVDSVRLLW
jgi:hypothetical protein